MSLSLDFCYTCRAFFFHLSLMKKFSVLWVILGGLLLLAPWVFGSYNGLIRQKEGVDAAWAQVETQYQRRFDLVPNLVNTVKGAAEFEQQTFTDLAEARSRWQTSTSRDDKIAAADSLGPALGRLIAVAENYPQLQATQAFRDLMAQLEGTENRISVSRKDFNDVVQSYNVSVKTFPRNIIAGMLGFAPEKFFQNAPGSENAPSVNF